MKNLRLFGTESQYNIEAPSLEYPTISYITDSDTVKWMKKPGPHDYSEDYLTFEALEDGSFTLNIPNSTFLNITSISYSLDNGKNWTTTTLSGINSSTEITTPVINKGNTVLWKGVCIKLCSGGNGTPSVSNIANRTHFTSTGNFNISGNILSLLQNDDFIEIDQNVTVLFSDLFAFCEKAVDAKNLVLPSTPYGEYTYEYMFYNCTSLISAPSIPSQIGFACCQCMFTYCTSLINAPELPATTLTEGCYNGMFSYCTSLINAPELPAISLSNMCYYNMFSNCTSLINAPELPATTLTERCYNNMFRNCTNLKYIKAMFTTTPSTSYTNNWVYGVSSTGTFVKNSAATWNVSGNNGIPTGWTVETASE